MNKIFRIYSNRRDIFWSFLEQNFWDTSDFIENFSTSSWSAKKEWNYFGCSWAFPGDQFLIRKFLLKTLINQFHMTCDWCSSAEFE